jgi:hypothetical protein
MFDNPSAGKFGPPPAPAEPGSSRSRRRFRVGGLLLLLAPLVKWLAPMPKEWAYALWATLTVAGLILDWALLKGEADEKGPYAEPDHLTR